MWGKECIFEDGGGYRVFGVAVDIESWNGRGEGEGNNKYVLMYAESGIDL